MEERNMIVDRAVKPKHSLRFTGNFQMDGMTAKAQGTLRFTTPEEFRAELTKLYNECVRYGYVKDA